MLGCTVLDCTGCTWVPKEPEEGFPGVLPSGELRLEEQNNL